MLLVWEERLPRSELANPCRGQRYRTRVLQQVVIEVAAAATCSILWQAALATTSHCLTSAWSFRQALVGPMEKAIVLHSCALADTQVMPSLTAAS